MHNETKVVSIQGMEMTIYESDIISDCISQHGIFWENWIMDKWETYLPTDGLILDIGANIGNHCLMFHKKSPNLKIWAFEMSYENFKLLYKNTLPYKEIKCFNLAIGDSVKIISYDDSPLANEGETINNGGISINKSGSGSKNNISIPLDSLNIPEPVVFIKIDIEDYEIYAFEGMKNLLLRDKPLIWVEDWAKFGKPMSETRSSVDYLIDLGYEIIDEIRCDYLLRYKNI